MSNVNLDLYKTFYNVAKYKNMTKAANELLVSQPAISKSIRALEGQIGGTLFYRSNKGLELTEEGKMLYKRIKPALEIIHNAENEFKEYQKLNIGEIKIGISSVLTKCLLLDTLGSFKIKYPNINFYIENGLTSNLIQKLNEGKLDFVIYNESNIIEKNVESNFLTKLNYVFCYNPMFFEINNKEIKTFNDLNKYPLLLQNKNSNTRKYLDKTTNNELIPYMEVVSQDLICNLAHSGLGIGFAFDKLVDLLNLNLKKLTISSIPSSTIYIAKNNNIDLSFAAKTFIRELKNNI